MSLVIYSNVANGASEHDLINSLDEPRLLVKFFSSFNGRATNALLWR